MRSHASAPTSSSGRACGLVEEDIDPDAHSVADTRHSDPPGGVRQLLPCSTEREPSDEPVDRSLQGCPFVAKDHRWGSEFEELRQALKSTVDIVLEVTEHPDLLTSQTTNGGQGSKYCSQDCGNL